MSTTASVSNVALKLRNAEIGPRVTAATSTGTCSAADWRALSFSASAAFFAAAGSVFAEAAPVPPTAVLFCVVAELGDAAVAVALPASPAPHPASKNKGMVTTTASLVAARVFGDP